MDKSIYRVGFPIEKTACCRAENCAHEPGRSSQVPGLRQGQFKTSLAGPEDHWSRWIAISRLSTFLALSTRQHEIKDRPRVNAKFAKL